MPLVQGIEIGRRPVRGLGLYIILLIIFQGSQVLVVRGPEFLVSLPVGIIRNQFIAK